MANSHPVSTPFEPGLQLPKLTSEDIDNLTKDGFDKPYREAVGSLLYLMVATRPDLGFAVGAVSQFNSAFGDIHWQAVKRILRYIKGTTHFGLCLGGEGNKVVHQGYADADWANDPATRPSLTGLLMTLGTGAFSWQSKKQDLVTMSTTEAECVALAAAVQQVALHRRLLLELGEQSIVDNPTAVYQDNQSCIAICDNNSARAKTKFIDVRYFYLGAGGRYGRRYPYDFTRGDVHFFQSRGQIYE